MNDHVNPQLRRILNAFVTPVQGVVTPDTIKPNRDAGHVEFYTAIEATEIPPQAPAGVGRVSSPDKSIAQGDSAPAATLKIDAKTAGNGDSGAAVDDTTGGVLADAPSSPLSVKDARARRVCRYCHGAPGGCDCCNHTGKWDDHQDPNHQPGTVSGFEQAQRRYEAMSDDPTDDGPHTPGRAAVRHNNAVNDEARINGHRRLG